ncbi:hypothetical protein [Mucilaginibacter sp. dw_454]|uniref:hypothetical protein n=1 Tax=Mucilaginibacter sp. dw_454 TaxID=2720079 RepID=UPI001BD23672|nr:hypothetical protein [Mucilaginibacter sp. dw_454]
MIKPLPISLLEDGHSTGLSVRTGGFYSETASVCLNLHGHPVKVNFPVSGALAFDYELESISVDQMAVDSSGDVEEATQFGAMGLAILIINDQTGWKVKRSWKGTTFDFWVGEEDDTLVFQKRARLEVSGDFKGTDTEIAARLKQKMEQTKPSDHLKIPAYGIVVEFSNPKSMTGKR